MEGFRKTQANTMKNRKRIVISTLGLVLLAVLTVTRWFLGDDAWIKGKVEDTVSEMTGRSLTIDGAFELDWSFSPVLKAENVHFANPSWAVNQDLAKLANLEVSIGLFSLLKDQIEVHYITINGLVVALEERESGENSWEILSGQKDPDPESDVPPAELPVSIGRFTLADFSLFYEAPDRAVPLDFHLAKLELTQKVDQQIQFTTDGQFGGEQFALAGNLGPLNELVAGGKTSHDIRLTLGEIALQSQGSIEQSSTLSGANIKLAFSGPEFEWLLTQLALPLFSHGDFDFRLDLKTEGEQTRLDLDGDLGSLQAYAKGNLNDLDGTAELTADVTGEDLGGLLEIVGVPGIPRNPFSLKVVMGHAPGMYQVQTLVLESADRSISVSGQMGDWPGLIGTALSLEVKVPSLQPIGELLDYSLPDESLRLSMKLQGTPKTFQAEQLEIKLGPSDLSGEISVDLEGKPRINGVFESNYLDLAWLQKADEGENTGEQAAEKSKQTYLIPDSPVTLPRIDFANSDIEITLNKIDLPHQALHDIHIRSRVTDGNLYLDPFQARGEDGGVLSGSLAVEQKAGNDITSVALSLIGDDVRFGLGTVEGQDPETIRSTDIFADLRGAGTTYRDLARSLDGRIEVVQGPGLTGNSGLSLIFGNFIGELFNMLNPFAKTEKFTVNECAVAIVNVESGMVTVEPVISQTDKMTLVAKGEVDLHTENILLSFNTKLRKGIGISASMVVNPFVSVTGTLLKPVVGLDPSAMAVKGTVAVATVGISLLVKSLADRYLSSKDPCGDALKKSREQLESTGKKRKSDH